MKYWFASLLAVLLECTVVTAEPAPEKKGFVVHEWGVFRVDSDAEFANADSRAEWDDLPDFVYGHIKRRVVPQHWRVPEYRRQPIIFFHASEPLLARVKVEFPGGQAGVWFPATENPAVLRNEKQPKFGNILEWDLGIKQCPNNWLPKSAAPPNVNDKHWINRVRQVKSDEIFSKYSRNLADVEREKFIYYDGIFPQGKWLKIAVDKEKVAIASQVKHPVYNLTVVDRRNDKVRIGRIDKLGAGETVEKVTFADVEESRFLRKRETLLKQLTSAGLFEDEARSLVDLRKKDFFETPGLNLFFRLPQEEYDARLPLTVTPKPESTVRVGLVHQAHLEPDFAAVILELAKQLDSERFSVRDAAAKKLHQIGPAALVQLQRIRERKDLSFEVCERIDALIKKWNVKESFDEGIETPKK